MLSQSLKNLRFSTQILALSLLLLALIEGMLYMLGAYPALPPFVNDAKDSNYLVFNPEIIQHFDGGPSGTPIKASTTPFLKQKPVNGFRVFILGESPLQAFPDGPSMSISHLLRQELEGLLPNRHVEVIPIITHANNSLLLFDISRAIPKHQADAVIIYLGHSAYTSTIGHGQWPQYAVEEGSAFRYSLLSNFRSWRAIYSLVHSKESEYAVKAQEGQSNNDDTHAELLTKFANGMHLVLGKFQRKKIPTILSAPISKLQNQQPFLSEPLESEWEDSLYRAEVLHQKAGGRASPELRNLLRQLYLRYPQHAGINYLMGMHAYNTDAALPYFIAARDFDQRRLRADSKLIVLLEDLAKEYGLQFSNAFPRLAAADSTEIPGASIFVDHIHFTVYGKELLAKHFAAEIALSFGLPNMEEIR